MRKPTASPKIMVFSANCNVFVLEYSQFSEHSGQQDIRYGIEHPTWWY